MKTLKRITMGSWILPKYLVLSIQFTTLQLALFYHNTRLSNLNPVKNRYNMTCVRFTTTNIDGTPDIFALNC